jgi:hypothetical protein
MAQLPNDITSIGLIFERAETGRGVIMRAWRDGVLVAKVMEADSDAALAALVDAVRNTESASAVAEAERILRG